ncbi:MAG TPA: YraN family protein [Desulfobacteraceae bacterium]|nr:YraN family protein [Desulfobacteraceae bacterium]
MTRERLELGMRGEQLAVEKLKGLGYKVLERNYRCPFGEIDLIARHHKTLVFVEIKTRRGRPLAYAKEAVNAGKRRRLSKTALAYMKANGACDSSARFDVVAVSLINGPPEVEVVTDAFELAY